MSHYISKMQQGTVAVDDMLLVKGVAATAGSRMLENFVPLFTAEAVQRLEQAGYTVAGKSNVGPFGLDLVGEFSHFDAPTKDGKLVGAAADLVASGEVKAALGVDLNGSARRAAALSGVKYIKPTYGTVSRYGVIACACSGEQVGVYAADTAMLRQVLSTVAGHDDKDGTSLPEAQYTYDLPSVQGKKVAIVTEWMQGEAAEDVRRYAEVLKNNGVCVEEISCDLVKAAQLAWQILMAAETCNNLSRYDGVKFGHRTAQYNNIDDLYVNSRTEGFDLLTKTVILYGSHVLSKGRYTACYDKALRIRRLVSEKLADIFAQYDAVLLPACSQKAYEPYPIEQAFGKVYDESLYTAVANLTGIPALVSGGVQWMGKAFSEGMLMSLAACAEGEVL